MINLLACATEPRNVLATCRFRGGPGREAETAEAWAFELTYYFLRGVGEQPRVTWENGIYTCTGLMTTTHPGDRDHTVFGEHSQPWDLDYSCGEDRQMRLRALYKKTAGRRFDGRLS